MTLKLLGHKVPGTKYFDDRKTQEKTISSLMSYLNREGVSIIGFMPVSLNYNLDTLQVIIDENIPFLLSNPVNPPYIGFYEKGYRNPEMAYYLGNSSNVVLLPVSYPPSTTLLAQPDPEKTFSDWKVRSMLPQIMMKWHFLLSAPQRLEILNIVKILRTNPICEISRVIIYDS